MPLAFLFSLEFSAANFFAAYALNVAAAITSLATFARARAAATSD
ncbi:MAG: hypothetical protein WBG11_10110 [Methylocella sp.]